MLEFISNFIYVLTVGAKWLLVAAVTGGFAMIADIFYGDEIVKFFVGVFIVFTAFASGIYHPISKKGAYLFTLLVLNLRKEKGKHRRQPEILWILRYGKRMKQQGIEDVQFFKHWGEQFRNEAKPLF